MPQNLTRRKASRRLNRIRASTTARSAPGVLATNITSPEQPVAVIILPVTVPLSPSSKGLRRVAAGLQDRGFATFVAELLSPEETEHGYHNFDFEMLSDRISEVTRSLRRELPFADLPLGYFATSTDAAALTIVAAQSGRPLFRSVCQAALRSNLHLHRLTPAPGHRLALAPNQASGCCACLCRAAVGPCPNSVHRR